MQTILIEDDPTALFLTKRVFHHEAVPGKLTAFLSPVEGLAFIQEQVQAETPPEVILLDLNIPLLSGWDILAALEPLRERLMGRCLVYVLTSSLAASDIARAEACPLVAGFIHKPLDRHELQAIQAQVRKNKLP